MAVEEQAAASSGEQAAGAEGAGDPTPEAAEAGEAEAGGDTEQNPVNDRILGLFRENDPRRDGTIASWKLVKVLKQVNEEVWTDSRIAALFAEGKLNDTSIIYYEEFLAWLFSGGGDPKDFCLAVEPVPENTLNSLVRSVSEMAMAQGRGDMSEALQELHDAPWEAKEPAMTLLLRLLQNIHDNPDNVKFRRLKKTNKTLATKVFSVNGCSEFLLAAGFEEEGDELVLPDGVDLKFVIDELSDWGKQEIVVHMRGERDKKVAAARAEEAKKNKLKSAGLPQGGGGAEERRLILEQAENDRKEREANAKLAAEGYKVHENSAAEKSGGTVTRFADVGIDLNKGGG